MVLQAGVVSLLDTEQMRKNDGNEKHKYKTKHTGTKTTQQKMLCAFGSVQHRQNSSLKAPIWSCDRKKIK